MTDLQLTRRSPWDGDARDQHGRMWYFVDTTRVRRCSQCRELHAYWRLANSTTPAEGRMILCHRHIITQEG